MPWYWTDDLARSLLAAGKVEPSKVAAWLVSPVAIRSGESSSEIVAVGLLEEENEPPPMTLALAA